LQEVGEVMHIANSGRVIIQLSKPLPDGKILFDKTGRKIARVTELIGLVEEPYASAIPLVNNIKKVVGNKVFATDQAPAVKQRKYKRKRR